MIRASVLAAAAALALAAAAWAQQPRQEEAVFRVDVNLVTLPVQVSTLDGSAARQLERDDFILLDNGEPRAIESVWFEKDLPLTLGLLVDVSDSQADWVAAHRATVEGFLRRLLRKDDRAFLLTVGSDVRLVTEPTASLPELLAGLQSIEKSGEQAGALFGEQCPKRVLGQSRPNSERIVIAACGGTALWNAVWAASRLKMRAASGRKALLILSDGIDTGSSHSLPHAAAELQRAETVAYAIQYPRKARRSSVGLQRLAEETGGLRFLPPEDSYEPVFARIEEDLRNQYVLGFSPPAESGFHRIELATRDAGVRVRTRSGYFVSAPATAAAPGSPAPPR